MLQPILFGLPVIAILVGFCAQTESTPVAMFDPQAEYLTSLRVDSALERCIQLIGTQSVQRFRKSVTSANVPGINNFSQMEQLRQCMLQQFAGKVPYNRWSIIEGIA
ncbi:unnamed protein product [Echinostoma caproni]|uniref:Conserved secreted protein n=1 Tax=Echinostoma caproni TaxID=27848 RepID=A0A183A9D9_9TREM|nr:unnamed protein product [Echinostoma caproni]